MRPGFQARTQLARSRQVLSQRPSRTMKGTHRGGSCGKLRNSLWAKWSGCQTRNSAVDARFENQTAQHKEKHYPVSPRQLPEFWNFLRFCHSYFLFARANHTKKEGMARPGRFELPTLCLEVRSTKLEVPLLVSLTETRAIYLALELDRRWTEMLG